VNRNTTKIDPEVAATLRALRRASDRALRLAQATGTPFWVMKNGRMVNLNTDAKRRRKGANAATKTRKR
jgi:hypothetical protein